MSRATRAGTCPQCGKPADPSEANAFRPFCCERCKMADLGQWFAGRYSIPSEPDDEPPPDSTPPQ